MPDFLLELGTEEIPAGYIQPAVEQGALFLKEELKARQLGFSQMQTFYTPRRMVFYITGLPIAQPDAVREISGPPASAAFDKDGKPTAAFFGFIKKNNLA